jgi:hypothetical protein
MNVPWSPDTDVDGDSTLRDTCLQACLAQRQIQSKLVGIQQIRAVATGLDRSVE